MEQIIYKKGQVIIEESSFGNDAYIIITGQVEVSKTINGIKTVFAVLGKSQIFGEMGLIEDKPRSATVTALEETAVSVANRAWFNENFSSNRKIILPIVKSLFERLRMAIATIAENEEKDALEIEKKRAESSLINKRDKDVSIILTGTNDISRKALNGSSLEIEKIPFRVGRIDSTLFNESLGILDTENDFSIKESGSPYYVSPNHFLIDKVENEYIIIDRGSHSGLVVNGKSIRDSCVLNRGDNELIVGSSFSPFVFTLTIKHKSGF